MYARENVDRNNGLYIKYRNMKCLDVNRFKESLERAPSDTAFVFDDVDDIVYVKNASNKPHNHRG